MRMAGLGADFTGTVTPVGTTPGGATVNPNGVSCCTYAQATSPTWYTTGDGSTRYDDKGNYCDPNCDAGYFQNIVGSIFGSGTTPPASGSNVGQMIAIASIVGVIVLVLAKR